MNIQEAEFQFSQILHRANSGEEINITKAGMPYVRLVPPLTSDKPEPGKMKGITEDICEPVTDDDNSAWG